MNSHHNHVHYSIEKEISVHRIDVRSKIINTFVIVLACTFLVDLYQLFWFFILFLFSLVILKPRKTFIIHSVAILPIILSLSFVSFFSFSTKTIVYKNIFYETMHNNLSFALFSGFRSLLIAFFVLSMINSEESFFEVIYGLDDLKLPKLLTNLIFLTYRFFFLMQEEFSRILEARSNRLYGNKFHINLTSLTIIGNIIGSVLARSFKRAEYISATLTARGFSGKISHPEQPWTYRGLIYLIINILLVILILINGQMSPNLFLEEFL